MHVRFHNTAEHGRVTLGLEGSRAWGFDYESARRWMREYPQIRAEGIALGAAAPAFSDQRFLLLPDESLPLTVEPG
ncbi:MAG TPA: hypothetical protein VH951_00075, partial [Dehalococcoidia bacterium]